MQVRVWGCRGSLAAPGPDTVRYGGNTSCVEVRLSDEDLIVLDAGTGIRPLGLSLDGNAPKRIHLLLTHLHLDHLEGLGFFGPLWQEGIELHIWGPPSPVRSLKSRIAKYLSPPLFPVRLHDIPSHPIFHDVPDSEWEIAGSRITAGPVKHPDPTVGYRIENGSSSFAYIPDHEPARGGLDLKAAETRWISGYEIASEVDVLLHDCQYTPDEYDSRVGWGHSSVEHTVAFSEVTKAKRLLMFHHDPMHTDPQLEDMRSEARSLWRSDSEPPDLAHEGMKIDFP